jgi:hypothetical protein
VRAAQFRITEENFACIGNALGESLRIVPDPTMKDR